MRIFGVILAGGQGQRMGGVDKAFLTLGGRPLIRRVLDRFAPQVDAVILSANGDPARFSALGYPVVADGVSRGPLSGIRAALHHAAASGATHLVSTPVDTPFLPADLVGRLVAAAAGSSEGLALACTADGDHPASALWPVALAPALAAFLEGGGAKITGFTDAHGAARAVFPDARAFLNLNTREDLAEAEALLKDQP